MCQSTPPQPLPASWGVQFLPPLCRPGHPATHTCKLTSNGGLSRTLSDSLSPCLLLKMFHCRQNPQHKVDYSTLVMNAEQSLERKWRKYFGGKCFSIHRTKKWLLKRYIVMVKMHVGMSGIPQNVSVTLMNAVLFQIAAPLSLVPYLEPSP